jgi:hypothetical protein
VEEEEVEQQSGIELDKRNKQRCSRCSSRGGGGRESTSAKMVHGSRDPCESKRRCLHLREVEAGGEAPDKKK